LIFIIVQIITLMDQLLRRENLDLRLTPYRVLATSSRHGMVEFVDASAIAEILSTEGSILSFFRRHNPQVSRIVGPLKLPNVKLDGYWKHRCVLCTTGFGQVTQ
jgi:hypothetical protein